MRARHDDGGDRRLEKKKSDFGANEEQGAVGGIWTAEKKN